MQTFSSSEVPFAAHQSAPNTSRAVVATAVRTKRLCACVHVRERGRAKERKNKKWRIECVLVCACSSLCVLRASMCLVVRLSFVRTSVLANIKTADGMVNNLHGRCRISGMCVRHTRIHMHRVPARPSCCRPQMSGAAAAPPNSRFQCPLSTHFLPSHRHRGMRDTPQSPSSRRGRALISVRSRCFSNYPTLSGENPLHIWGA